MKETIVIPSQARVDQINAITVYLESGKEDASVLPWLKVMQNSLSVAIEQLEDVIYEKEDVK